MRLMIAAAVSALFGATPALAQEEKPFEGASVTAIAGIDATTVGGTEANFLYGGQAGYDVQSNTLVYGVEAEATGRTRSGCITFTQVAYRSCDRGGRDLYLGGRLGMVVGRSTLVYGKLGYTNRRESYQYQSPLTGPVVRVANTYDGFRLGAGVEQRLGGSISLKAEYRFSKYGGLVDLHQAVAGLGYRF